jgi:hypothetical protein
VFRGQRNHYTSAYQFTQDQEGETIMAAISIDVVIGQLLAVLKEAFEGPQQWGYFTDAGREGAMLGTLGELNAEQASRALGGTSIAAHVYHTTFGLEASSAWINGDRTSRNWPDSWRVSTVDAATWKNRLEEMNHRYQELSKAIESKAASSMEAVGGAVAAIAHVAYHLGAIRQKTGMLEHS